MSFNKRNINYYGLDVPVNSLRDSFTSKLFSGLDYTSRGLVYNINNDGVPMFYNESNSDYCDVFPDDNIDALSFFYENGEGTRIDGRSYFNTGVEIIFAVKLDSVKSAANTRNAQDLAQDIFEVIRTNSLFEVTGIQQGKNAYSSFDLTKIEQKDLFPYLFIKFNTNVNYKLE